MKYIIHSVLLIGLFTSCEMMQARAAAKSVPKEQKTDPNKNNTGGGSGDQPAPAPGTAVQVQAWTQSGSFTLGTKIDDKNYNIQIQAKNSDGSSTAKNGNLTLDGSASSAQFVVDATGLTAVGLSGDIGVITYS